MGPEEIRAHLDDLVAAGGVPPDERESVRAQVTELAATDPKGADRYRTELARLDPRLFPPPDATALARLLLLRSVRPWRPVIGKALALIPERDMLRTDLETLWEQTKEARARYQVPSHAEVLQDGSPTMLICERLIAARMKETGFARNNITVVVAGHDGVSAEVGVWLKLGVTVVAVEIEVCNQALKTSRHPPDFEKPIAGY